MSTEHKPTEKGVLPFATIMECDAHFTAYKIDHYRYFLECSACDCGEEVDNPEWNEIRSYTKEERAELGADFNSDHESNCLCQGVMREEAEAEGIEL